MSLRSIIQVFDTYQKARLTFVQAVADLALRPQNVELLEKAGFLELIKPLLSDAWAQIRQCATVAMGRLVQNSVEMADKVIRSNILPLLLTDIHMQNKSLKRSILFIIRSLCKHNAKITENVVKAGAIPAIMNCLEDFEPSVKEAAAWAVGYVARHNTALAQSCVDAGAVPQLMLCLQDPELSLRQIAVSALADVAKHSPEMAQSLVDGGGLPYLSRNLNCTDEKLKRQVLFALSSCAKHSEDLAEMVVETEIFPSVLIQMAHPCPGVRKNAACLVRDIAKHSTQLTQLVVNNGGISALMEVLDDRSADVKVPAVTAIGHIAGHSSQLALSVIGCKVVVKLTDMLQDPNSDDILLTVTAWTLAQIGRHSPEHSNAVASANVFPRLVELLAGRDSSEDLKAKCKMALKLCLQKCILISALEPLLTTAPAPILKYVLGQYSKILPHDPKARRLFVETGGLRKVQEMDAQPGTVLREYKNTINSCFPEEIVRYYSPGYPETILEKVEQYSPQMASILRESSIDEPNNNPSITDVDSVTSEEVQSLMVS